MKSSLWIFSPPWWQVVLVAIMPHGPGRSKPRSGASRHARRRYFRFAEWICVRGVTRRAGTALFAHADSRVARQPAGPFRGSDRRPMPLISAVSPFKNIRNNLRWCHAAM